MVNSRTRKNKTGKYTRRGSVNKITAGSIKGKRPKPVKIPESSYSSSSNIAKFMEYVKTPIPRSRILKTKTRKMRNIIGMLKSMIRR